MPDLVLENAPEEVNEEITLGQCNLHSTPDADICIDLTNGGESLDETSFENEENDDVIIVDAPQPATFVSSAIDHSEVPEQIYWESILSSIERCSSSTEMISLVNEIHKTMRPLRRRTMDVFLNPACDAIDTVASSDFPSDGPKNVHPVWTLGDGNCLTRSLGKGFSGSDNMHVEIRARIVVDGIMNKKFYLSPACLNRGASLIRQEESLPVIYTKYSDYYVNGQKITEDTIEYVYLGELHECSRLHTYMGLWQLAQAANALQCRIHSVYPDGRDELM